MKLLSVAMCFLATVVSSACSDTTIDSDPLSLGGGSEAQARLTQIDDSAAFYIALEEALINQTAQYLGDEDDNTDVNVTLTAPGAPSSAPQGEADSSAGSELGGNEVTSTNIQEMGVDEIDRVKVNAAGAQLFVLHNEYGFSSDNTVVPSAPDRLIPTDTSMPASERPRTTLRILALDAETPDATGIKDLNIELDGRTADGFYLYESGAESSVVITAAGGGYWGYWDQPTAFAESQSIIAKVDVQDAANASLTESFTLDGQIIASRRMGDSLFFASRYYPAIPGVTPWRLDRDQWREAVESADLSELLPEYSRSNSEQTTPLVNASSCFVAPQSIDQPFYSPDIITLGVIDLSSMELIDAECFLGATETLYANTESVFLATTQYAYDEGPITNDGAVVNLDVNVFDGDLVWSDPRATTDIHQFDIQNNQLNYAGSGSVSGHFGWNPLQKPFRMSADAGYLRVATMNDQQGPDHSPILLNILQADGQGNLRTVSTLPNAERPEHIGEPGEQLYASRFLGDRAYLVTFRQTDPLYVIDMANPEDPEVTGELKIDGYSDYLQPISENFLLGIGKDAVPSDDRFGDGRGAWVQGIKLSLFDVSDPSAPAEVQSVLVGQRGTESVALTNHRAITIQPATDLHPTRVSFGIDVYGDPAPITRQAQGQAFDYTSWNYTGLHGFDVTAGANASINPRGVLVVERANGANRPFPSYGDDRSVMVNDALFYIHGRSVYPALWDNLEVASPAR